MRTTLDKAALHRLMRRQDGVLSQKQALELGLTRAAIRDRVEARDWIRVAHLVYRGAEHPDSARARVRAAMLSLGDAAVLVGRTALWWWRLEDTEPGVIEIAVPPGSRPRARAGVRLFRRVVHEVDRMVVDGIAVTKKAPTVLTAAASMPLIAGAAVLDRALSSRAVALDDLHEVQLRTAGRWGSQRARELLVLADGGARSAAERLAHTSMLEAGITGWTPNLSVRLPGYGTAVLDVAFHRSKIAIEIDGWTYHRDLRAFLRDGPRQNALVLAGWTVIRVSWYDLVRAPEAFVAMVRAALSGRPEDVPS